MNNISKTYTQSSPQVDKKPIFTFFKVLMFYGFSFSFWVLLFINNDGVGGVEAQHLVMMGIIHAILVFFHAMALFTPKPQNNE